MNLKAIKGQHKQSVFKNVCIQIEEANTTEDKYSSDRNKTAEKLKPLITQSLHRVEEKFIPSSQQTKHFGLALTSNFDNPVLIEDTDRRYFVSWKSEKRADNKTFFNVMANWLTNEDGLQEMCDYLHSVNLDGFDFRNPPMTNQKKNLMEVETSAESKTDLAMVFLRSNPTYAFKLHSIQSHFKVSQYDAKQAMRKAGFERSARKRFIKGADAFSLWFHKDCPEKKIKEPNIWINENSVITIYPEMTEEAITIAKEFI